MAEFIKILKILFFLIVIPGSALYFLWRAIFVLSGMAFLVSAEGKGSFTESNIGVVSNWPVSGIDFQVGYYGKADAGQNVNSGVTDWAVFWYGFHYFGLASIFYLFRIIISLSFWKGLIAQNGQ
jgi:hypothetical protein